MTLDQAKEEILKRQLEFFTKTNDGNGYVCPICNYGSVGEQEGMKQEEDSKFTCPSGCFYNFDFFEVIGLKYNINNEAQIIKALARELNIELEEENENKDKKAPIKNTKNTQMVAEGDVNYSLFYKECIENINNSSYMQERGISRILQSKFGVGFCEEWIHPETKEDVRKYIALTPRVIIPTSSFSYVAIHAGDKKSVSNIQRVGKPILFNQRALYEGNNPIFILENEMDALSVIECGYDAIAYGELNNYKLIIETLTKKSSNRFLIICLDDSNEDVLQVLTSFQKELKGINQEYIVYNLVGNNTSINDILIQNKTLLIDAIQEGYKKVHEYEMKKVKEYQQKYSNIQYMKEFINKEINTPYIPTGISKLDESLDGGFYEGFYVLNANKSIGKTTFALQVADNIAAGNSDTDVLIFSLEASAKELITKSLSRITATRVYSENGNLNDAKTIRDISVKTYYDKLQENDKILISDACEEYKKFAESIYVYEGNNDTSVMQIRDNIKEHLTKVTKADRNVVVIIDYLQVLASEDNNIRTDNQNMVKNIAELKRISRDYNIPILAISSMNNSDDDSLLYTGNYNEKDVLQHSSDVLLNLCFINEDNKDFDELIEIKKRPMSLVIKVLKNRNGKAGEVINFDYYPEYNLFM